MSVSLRRLLVAVLVTAACRSGGSGSSGSSYPLPDEGPASAAAEPPAAELTESDPADLGECELMARSETITDLRCPAAMISEIRATPTAETGAMLDEVMASLGNRYGGELDIEPATVTVDGAKGWLRQFVGVGGGMGSGVSGLVVALDNEEGLFWAVACFREDAKVDRAWCRRAVLAVAQAGGANRVGAAELDPLRFGDRTLTVPEGCAQEDAARIRCDTGELSWTSAAGRDVDTIRGQTVERLRSLASAEGVELEEDTPTCQLDGADAECSRAVLRDREEGSVLTFVLAVAAIGDAPLLAVCSYSGTASEPPPPCDAVLSFSSQ